ncbi:unnamed protein product [Urochloa humidicola]
MGSDLQLPPGFRFHPTDEELVMHYLCRRCAGLPIAVPIIAEIDLYKFDPWQLPRMALYGEKEWYFFSPRDRKYPNGSRPNRAAGTGYWKATGADKPVGTPKPLAIKKALVFYAGKAPKGEKTNWIMHEYRLADVDRSARKKNSLRMAAIELPSGAISVGANTVVRDVDAAKSIPADVVTVGAEGGDSDGVKAVVDKPTADEMHPEVVARLKMVLPRIDPTFRDIFVSMLKFLVLLATSHMTEGHKHQH